MHLLHNPPHPPGTGIRAGRPPARLHHATIALCMLLAIGYVDAVAQEAKDPWGTWNLSLGGFIADVNSEMRIGTPGIGTDINLERVLGIKPDRWVFRGKASYAFGHERRHRAELNFFDLSQSSTRVLATEIEVGDTVYPVGTTVSSQFDLMFVNLRYTYAFIRDDRVSLAASLGVHITTIGLEVAAPERGATGDRVTAPLPLLGAELDVLLAEDWYMRSSVEALYLRLGGVRGLIIDGILSAEYRAWEQVGLGMGVNTLRFRLEQTEAPDGGNLVGSAGLDFIGFLLYATVVI